MTERLGGEARQAVLRAQEQARRLGQEFIGCEHLLYGVAAAEDVAGGVLRARGVTPERIEEQVVHLIRGSRAVGRLATRLDGDALSTIGVDLNAVRGRIEEAFGPGALERAADAPSGVRSSHLRVTRQARKCIDRSIREAEGHRADARTTAYIALALLAMNTSVPRRILTALGVSASHLATEIKDTLKCFSHMSLPRRAAAFICFAVFEQLVDLVGMPSVGQP